MNVIKNIQFTLLISINKQLHEFNFRKRSSGLYDTDTGDEQGNRYFFKMSRAEEKWKIEGVDLPAWITTSEMLINAALLNEDPRQL
ncbi:MAG: hypothetical protein JWM28_585 [Chitinophagaceae bacterium]|nr:hypothetical protein [Chitinophagaceae bacterium]